MKNDLKLKLIENGVVIDHIDQKEPIVTYKCYYRERIIRSAAEIMKAMEK
jgi:aspartate carbamoyltransferase regulatory subunit